MSGMVNILLFLITLLFSLQPAFADNLKPILRLDTGGHTGIIRDIVVHPDGSHFISASDDKTVRVWKVEKSGDTIRVKEERKILGWIGDGSRGVIYAVALSPDGRYLAVGGFLAEGYGKDDDKVGIIRLYDFYTGKLIRTLEGHENIINDLTFSPDGRYLISGGFDNRVIIWNMKTFEKVGEY